MFVNRASTALVYNVNYTLPYQIFGTENGLYLMKVLDFQVFGGFIIVSIANYIFVFMDIFYWLFPALMLVDVLAIFLVSVFQKKYPACEKESDN